MCWLLVDIFGLQIFDENMEIPFVICLVSMLQMQNKLLSLIMAFPKMTLEHVSSNLFSLYVQLYM